jgi:MFS family permease
VSGGHPLAALQARWTIPLAMFVGSFAWSFVFVSLPFYIHRISTLDEVSTLRWTGWILGVSSLVTVVTAPLSGRLAGRGNPKAFYMLVQLLQGVGFLLMALARTLPQMLGARVLLGSWGRRPRSPSSWRAGARGATCAATCPRSSRA